MSETANDYIARVKEKNAKLFRAETIRMTPESLEKQLKAAFEAGKAAGIDSKSLFDSIFGRLK